MLYNDSRLALNQSSPLSTVPPTVIQTNPIPNVAAVLLWITVIFLGVVTVLGNILVIVAYYLDRSIRKSLSNRFIISLAASDCIIGVEGYPFYTHFVSNGEVWTLGSIACQTWLFLDYSLCLASILTVLLITIDRYLSVCHAAWYMNFQTKDRIDGAIVFSWIAPAILFGVMIYGWSSMTGEEIDPSLCYAPFLSNQWVNMAMYFTYYWSTLIAMLVLYTGIHKASKNLQKRLDNRHHRVVGLMMGQRFGAQLGVKLFLQSSIGERERPSLPTTQKDRVTKISMAPAGGVQHTTAVNSESNNSTGSLVRKHMSCVTRGAPLSAPVPNEDLEPPAEVHNNGNTESGYTSGVTVAEVNVVPQLVLDEEYNDTDGQDVASKLAGIENLLPTTKLTEVEVLESIEVPLFPDAPKGQCLTPINPVQDPDQSTQPDSGKDDQTASDEYPDSMFFYNSETCSLSSGFKDQSFDSLIEFEYYECVDDQLFNVDRSLTINSGELSANRSSFDSTASTDRKTSTSSTSTVFKPHHNYQQQDQKRPQSRSNKTEPVCRKGRSLRDSLLRRSYKNRLTQKPKRSKQEYLIDYAGFHSMTHSLSCQASLPETRLTSNLLFREESLDHNQPKSTPQRCVRINSTHEEYYEAEAHDQPCKQLVSAQPSGAPSVTLFPIARSESFVSERTALNDDQTLYDTESLTRFNEPPNPIYPPTHAAMSMKNGDYLHVPEGEQVVNERTLKRFQTAPGRITTRSMRRSIRNSIRRVVNIGGKPSAESWDTSGSEDSDDEETKKAKPGIGQLGGNNDAQQEGEKKDGHAFMASLFKPISMLQKKRKQTKAEKRARKAFRMITFVVGFFALLWSPYFIAATIYGFCPQCIPSWVFIVCYYLCYLNSAGNPFMYALANRQFKAAFLRILRGQLHRV